jgi:flavin-binding protein dodecin
MSQHIYLVKVETMADPFQRTNIIKTSRLGRLMRSRGAEAFAAIETLLAQAPSIQDVQPDVVWNVVAVRGIDLRRHYSKERKNLYRRYLEHCFADQLLSKEETTDLLHLRTMLHLGSDDVAEVHDMVARTVYGQAVEQVLADMRLDPEEEAFLRQLREELELPEEEAAKLYAEGKSRALAKARFEAGHQDPDFLEYRPPAGKFTGKSTTTIEDAVTHALQKATMVVPNLHWFELMQIAGHVEKDAVKDWSVVIRAGFSAEDLSLRK